MKFNLKLIVLCGASTALMACGDAASKSGDNPTSGGTYSFSNPTDDLPAPQNPGSGSGRGGEVKTSVTGSKTVESLTNEEREQLCRDAESTMSSAEVMEAFCRVTGVIQASFDQQGEGGSFGDSCQQGYDNCIAEGSNDFNCELPKENCAATVNDVVACYSAFVSAITGSNVPACSAATSADGESLFVTLQSQPAECVRLDELCPSLNDDEPTREPTPVDPVPANNGGF